MSPLHHDPYHNLLAQVHGTTDIMTPAACVWNLCFCFCFCFHVWSDRLQVCSIVRPDAVCLAAPAAGPHEQQQVGRGRGTSRGSSRPHRLVLDHFISSACLLACLLACAAPSTCCRPAWRRPARTSRPPATRRCCCGRATCSSCRAGTGTSARRCPAPPRESSWRPHELQEEEAQKTPPASPLTRENALIGRSISGGVSVL